MKLNDFHDELPWSFSTIVFHDHLRQWSFSIIFYGIPQRWSLHRSGTKVYGKYGGDRWKRLEEAGASAWAGQNRAVVGGDCQKSLFGNTHNLDL